MEAFKVSPRDRGSIAFHGADHDDTPVPQGRGQLWRSSRLPSRVLLALHPRTRLVPWMRLLRGVFRTFPQIKCGVGSALGVGTGVRTLIHGLPAAYAGSVVLEEESESELEPEEDIVTRFADLFRPKRVSARGSSEPPHGSAHAGCVPTATGAPSHTHGRLSFTRKLQPMRTNSPRNLPE